MTTNAAPTERQLKKQCIIEDQARAARWASRRRSQRNQEIPVATPAVEVPVVSPENSVLQDLVDQREVLLQELKDLDTAIAVILRTYAR